MVVIEQVRDVKTAVWVDGYMRVNDSGGVPVPDLNGLGTRKLSKTASDADALFRKRLIINCSRIGVNQRPGAPFWDDLYYLQMGQADKEPHARLPELYAELKREDQNRYRQLVIVYDTLPHSNEMEYVVELVGRCQLLVKPSERYEDFHRFERNVRRWLDDVLDPFCIPCAVVERGLEQNGFSVYHLTL